MKKGVKWSALIGLTMSMFLMGGCESEETTHVEYEEFEEQNLISENLEIDFEESENIEAGDEDIEEQIQTEQEPESDLVEESVPEPKAEYTYTDMSATMYATQTVNVRDLPSTDGKKIGSLSTNQEVEVKGQCNETSWYMLIYEGLTAFVSNKYLSSEKVEVAPQQLEVLPEPQPEPEPAPQSEPQAEPQPAPQPEASNGGSGGGAGVTVPDHEESGPNLVWVPTQGGKKYHRTSDCSGMEDPMQVSVETAEANGYTPCKRCYK